MALALALKEPDPALVPTPWHRPAGAYGPVRSASGEVVAIVYELPDGRWSWVVSATERAVGGDFAPNEPGARAEADRVLKGHGYHLSEA